MKTAGSRCWEPDTVSGCSLAGYGIGIRPEPVRYKLTLIEEGKNR